MNNRLYIAVLLMVVALQGKGQSDRLPVQYYMAPSLINPALSGKNDFIDLKAGYRKKMIDTEDSPSTWFFYGEKTYYPQGSMNDRLRKRMTEWDGRQSTRIDGIIKIGLGAFALRSEQGAFQHLKAGINTAVHVPVSPTSYLSLGLSPGIVNNRIDLSDIIVRDPATDQAYQSLLLNGASNTYFNLNSGLSFYSDRFLISYGIDKLAGALISGNEDLNIEEEMEHHFMGNYSLFLNPAMELIPTAHVRITEVSSVFYDAGLRWRYKRNLWTGLSYRSNETFVGALGFTTNNGIVLGYSYQHRSRGLDDFNNGSHEVVLGVNLR